MDSIKNLHMDVHGNLIHNSYKIEIKVRIELTIEPLPPMCKGMVAILPGGSRNQITNRTCYMIPFMCHFQIGNSVDGDSILVVDRNQGAWVLGRNCISLWKGFPLQLGKYPGDVFRWQFYCHVTVTHNATGCIF